MTTGKRTLLKVDVVIEDYKDEWLTVRYRRSNDVEVGLRYLKGKQLTAVFYEKQDIRSLPMNDLIHWYCRLISNHDGTPFDRAKADMKVMYGPRTTNKGQIVVKPTSQYSVREAIDFIDKLHYHCVHELNIDVNPGTEMFECYQEYRRKRRENNRNTKSRRGVGGD